MKNEKNEIININNELNVDEICDNIIKYKHVMIRADLQGSGKTYAAQHMIDLGYRVLFVCPTNKLAQNNGVNGATINTFVGMTINNEESLTKIDASQYDVIVFDEIYFANVRMLARTKRYADNNPNKTIIATSGTNQLVTCDPLVEELGDQYGSYVNRCLDILCPNSMCLKENKRLKSDEDKRTLKQFKLDIFDETKPIIQTLKKYFKFTDDIKTINNIAYRNETCNTVSKTIRKL